MSERPPIDAEVKPPRSLGRATRSGVLWAYLRTVVSLLVALPATFILARLLTPADFGIAAAATFFGQLAVKLSNAGMGISLVRIKVLRDDHVSSVFVVNTVLAFALSAVLVATAPAIAAFYRTPAIADVLPLVALDFLLGSFAMVSQAMLTRAMRYREMAAISSAEMIVTATASVVFAGFGFSYWSLVLGAVSGSVVKWLWGVRLVGWHLRFRFVPDAARELMSFALGTYTKGMLEYVSQNIDNLVIGRVLGVTALGFYDKAFSSVQRVFKKLTVVGPSVSFRALAILQDEPERFRRAFDKIIVTSTFVAYAMFAALGAMAPNLIVVLYGDIWRPSIVPFQLLCVAGALKIPSVYGGAAANARGWVWSNVWRQAVYTLCIVGGVYFAATWGVVGAAVAVAIATLLMFVLMQTLLRSATGLTWANLMTPHVPGMCFALCVGALVWITDTIARRSSDLPTWAILSLQVAVAGLVAIGFVRWCPFSSVREVIHEIIGDISPRLAAWVVPGHDSRRKSGATAAVESTTT